MALNLKRELIKAGVMTKNNKSFYLNKVKDYNDEDILKKNNILFEDPNTFLQLPNETNFNYIINKIPRGPQYDFEDKLIPYTMVGNSKYTKSNKYSYSTGSKSTSKKSSFNSRIKDPYFIRLNNTNSNYNIISDKEIKEIFNNYKNKIQENKNKYKDNLISKEECPKFMRQYIDKSLELQEKCLKKNVDNLNSFKNMGEFIKERMKLKAKAKKNRRRSNLQINSISKDINISLGELIMNSGEEYRLKNEAKSFYENKKNNNLSLPNVNQNWEMSLRRPKNFVGTRKELLNCGTPKYPYWIIKTEKSPKINEYILKPRKDFNCTTYGISSRTNSIPNLFNHELKKSKTNDDILKQYNKRNSNCDILEIQGQKLIDFEENLCRKLKGKKKLINLKNNKEEVKDILIHADYNFNNFKENK